ncbi:hypothetical protein CROQUDRAFT_650819 [Cronartium quercuum f. sp. fusiforme G11]|uniref:Zinc finger PHD-type domain-containing protein n=1 Tax=Cronartium quercuum f. sp. fusiforme G11 TaxID=708437 RepID=A0A9P6TH71_9BASI|nr:hypothetical protein CROQUDRAFT_650819 [Cronartium quercuum f. sp. fusiforme G11]
MTDSEFPSRPPHQLTPDHEDSESSSAHMSTTSSARLRTRTTTTTSNEKSITEGPIPKEVPSRLTNPQSAAGPTTTKKGSTKSGSKKSTKASAGNSAGGPRRASLNSKKEKRERKTTVPDQGPVTSDLSSPALHQHNPSSLKLTSDRAHADQNLDDEQNGSAVTRCVCGEDNEEANDVIMFQCDKCSVWQHGPCVGLYAEFPGDYFCELCRPDLHANGQYHKSSPATATTAQSKRSPSLTSSAPTHRRERVTTDAASLAAFLTDAGVKPEDQVSLGGFALPIFAQTRRQSNKLVDPLKKQRSPSAELSEQPVLKDTAKSKRKRQPEDLDEGPPHEEPEQNNNAEEKTKRRRISPTATELASPAPSNSTLGGKTQTNTLSATGPLAMLAATPAPAPVVPPAPKNNKRARKIDDVDESMKTKAFGPKPSLANPPLIASGSGSGSGGGSSTAHRRGSPTKRSKEDNRKPAREPTPQDTSVGWGLPDHLGYLSYLLPSPSPVPIASGEPATRVKFPPKRATVADLRKRAKHLVDYLTKVQIETSDREKRSELISKAASPSSFSDITAPVVSSETLEIMDDLTRELYHWQEKYKQ